ncbi:SF0329 family protein [Ferdinandcohnia sp. Marseille-Q9671]
MQWSKVKARLESFLCESLRGRIQLHASVYRKFHDSPGRVWITFDKKEIVSASDITYAVKHEELYQQIIKENELKSIPYNQDWKVMFNSNERKELVDASEIAEAILIKKGIFESHHLYEPFMRYSSLSIQEALQSDNVIIRAYSLLDRRVGKRSLIDMKFQDDTHPLVHMFYRIRCESEGITQEFKE